MRGEGRTPEGAAPAGLPAELLDRLEEAVWIAASREPEKTLYVSSDFEGLFGVPCRDPFGASPGWLGAVHDEDRPLAAQAHRDFLSGREEAAVECRLSAGKGAPRWVRIRAFRAGEGDALLVGTARDVSVRMRLDRTLRDNEEKYASLMERSLQGVAVLENAFPPRILLVNPAATKIFGRTAEEMLGAPPEKTFSYIHAEDREAAANRFQNRRDGKSNPAPMEFRVVRKDDSMCWVDTFVWPVEFCGRPAFQVALVDITEKKRVEAEMNRLQLVAERSNFGIVEAEMEGAITYVNPYMAAVHGYRPEELIGRPLSVFHDEHRSGAVDNILSILRGGGAFESQEVPHRRRDGSVFPMLMNGVILPDEKGRPSRMAATAVDITDRKRAEEEVLRHRDRLEKAVRERTACLREANRKLRQEVAVRKDAQERIRRLNERLEQRVRERTAELEKACADLKDLDRMKDAFVSSVSHELRTPLTSIRSFSEFLLQNDEEPETRRHYLEIIHTETERLAGLVEHVLELSQIESGDAGWTDEPFSPALVLREALRAREEECRARSIRLDLALAEDLPRPMADMQRIRQVADNLLDNAIKFSPDGGTIAVRAALFRSRRSSEPEEWLRVSIADQGPGIDPKYHEAIFDRFFQVSCSVLTDKPRGSGLGLPICRKIVGRYGGNVWVENAPGGGSVFTFTLPGPRSEAVRKKGAGGEARAESETAEQTAPPVS